VVVVVVVVVDGRSHPVLESEHRESIGSRASRCVSSTTTSTTTTAFPPAYAAEPWRQPLLLPRSRHFPHVAADEHVVWQLLHASQKVELTGCGDVPVVSVEMPMHQFQ